MKFTVHTTFPPQVMVAKVSSLLKTVKNVEDEASKGVQSLENTIDAIEAGINAYNSDQQPATEASPQDLIRSTKVMLTWLRYGVHNY